MTAVLALVAALVILTLPSPSMLRAGALAQDRRLGARLAPAAHASDPAAEPESSSGSTTPVTLIAAAMTVLAIVLAWGLLLGIASSAVLATIAVLVRDVGRRRAATRLHQELVTVVGVLAGELVAGAQPATALRAAAEVAVVTTATFTSAADVAGRGGDAAGVLTSAGVAGVRTIGLAWQVVESTGAALAQVMERVAGDLAAQDALRRTVTVALAGPRSSAVLLSLLPLVGIALGAAMGARPLGLLFGDSLGQALCCVGTLLDVAGVLWIRQIVRRVEPT